MEGTCTFREKFTHSISRSSPYSYRNLNIDFKSTPIVAEEAVFQTAFMYPLFDENKE